MTLTSSLTVTQWGIHWILSKTKFIVLLNPHNMSVFYLLLQEVRILFKKEKKLLLCFTNEMANGRVFSGWLVWIINSVSFPVLTSLRKMFKFIYLIHIASYQTSGYSRLLILIILTICIYKPLLPWIYLSFLQEHKCVSIFTLICLNSNCYW